MNTSSHSPTNFNKRNYSPTAGVSSNVGRHWCIHRLYQKKGSTLSVNRRPQGYRKTAILSNTIFLKLSFLFVGLLFVISAHSPYTQEYERRLLFMDQSQVLREISPRTSRSSTLDGISRTEVIRVIKLLCNGSALERGYVSFIFNQSKTNYNKIDTVYNLSITGNQKVTVVGSILGQFTTMLYIFENNGFPSPDNMYVFNGDFIGPGEFSLEVLLSLTILKMHCNECIHFNRGIHETDSSLITDSLKDLVTSKYDETIYELVVTLLDELPLAALINEKILVMNGCITNPTLSLKKMKDIERGIALAKNDLLKELIRADVQSEDGIGNQDMITTIGPNITEMFFDQNNLHLLVGGHRQSQDGYDIQHNGRVVTLWSAPSSESESKLGSFMSFGSDLGYEIVQFDAIPKVVSLEKGKFSANKSNENV